MENQEELAFELDNDALADALESDDFFTFGRTNWRLEGAQEKRAGQSNFLQRLI